MIARLKGMKTFLVFAPILLLSLLDALGQVDLTPILVALGVSETSRGAILTGMSVLALILRVLTTSPVIGAPGAKAGEPR